MPFPQIPPLPIIINAEHWSFRSGLVLNPLLSLFVASSERTLAHGMLQEHLSDRFYVPPSLLYSIVDPSRDGTAFTVPLDGDWVTIAVVAEQLGSVRSTKGGPAMGKEEDEESGDEMSAGGGGTGPNMNDGHGKPSQTAGKKKKWTPKSQKKFVTFRLVALPPRSSGKSATSGDATVNLILFEADSVADVKGGETRAGGSSKRRVYKGGSGGAFETFWNVKVGTVLAILNPRVLRPLKVRWHSLADLESIKKLPFNKYRRTLNIDLPSATLGCRMLNRHTP